MGFEFVVVVSIANEKVLSGSLAISEFVISLEMLAYSVSVIFPSLNRAEVFSSKFSR